MIELDDVGTKGYTAHMKDTFVNAVLLVIILIVIFYSEGTVKSLNVLSFSRGSPHRHLAVAEAFSAIAHPHPQIQINFKVILHLFKLGQ